MAHHSVNANINDMQISEDVHMTLVHVLMKLTRSTITKVEEPTVRRLNSSRRLTLKRKIRA